jgi:hypothetical protein
MDEKDLQVFRRDKSGINAHPKPGTGDTKPAERIFHVQHRVLHQHLSGASLDTMTTRYVQIFTDRIKNVSCIKHREWTELPDLFELLKSEMLRSNINALAGDHFFELSPNFADDFWEFDRLMLVYLRRLPRWMAPKTYATRDRVLGAVKKWRQWAKDHFDSSNQELVDSDYEPIWGTRIMRVRDETYHDIEPYDDGCASMEFGLVWASVSA